MTLAAFVKLVSLLLRSTQLRCSWVRLEPLEGTMAYLFGKKERNYLRKHTSTPSSTQNREPIFSIFSSNFALNNKKLKKLKNWENERNKNKTGSDFLMWKNMNQLKFLQILSAFWIFDEVFHKTYDFTIFH